MSDKKKKISKSYVASDSSVNCYGFRLLTSGYIKEEFEKNPIGYYMHNRAGGVVVRWENLRIEGDRIIADPVINLSNARGEQTVQECEDGFLNGASVGEIVAVEWTYDEATMLEGQIGPTVTKWYNRELSLVDIPGNFNGLALFDMDGNKINLADFTNGSKNVNLNSMKQLLFTPSMVLAMGLKIDANQEDAENALVNLAARAKNFDTDLAAAKKGQDDAVQALSDFKASSAKAEVTALLDSAVKEGRVTVQLSATLAKDYEGNPEGLKAILSAMPKYSGIVKAIENAQGVDGVAPLASKSWDELDKSGELPALKAGDIDAFKLKFKQKFGVDYKG